MPWLMVVWQWLLFGRQYYRRLLSRVGHSPSKPTLPEHHLPKYHRGARRIGLRPALAGGPPGSFSCTFVFRRRYYRPEYRSSSGGGSPSETPRNRAIEEIEARSGVAPPGEKTQFTCGTFSPLNFGASRAVSCARLFARLAISARSLPDGRFHRGYGAGVQCADTPPERGGRAEGPPGCFPSVRLVASPSARISLP